MRPDGTETDPRYAELQARLGYSFRNAVLCETAMTHTSWLNEAGQPERSDNERLEFLGDAVVDLVVSDMLMRRFPDRPEGDLRAPAPPWSAKAGWRRWRPPSISDGSCCSARARSAPADARAPPSSPTRWRR